MELWCILEAEERWIVANGQNPELAEVVGEEWYWQANKITQHQATVGG